MGDKTIRTQAKTNYHRSLLFASIGLLSLLPCETTTSTEKEQDETKREHKTHQKQVHRLAPIAYRDQNQARQQKRQTVKRGQQNSQTGLTEETLTDQVTK